MVLTRSQRKALAEELKAGSPLQTSTLAERRRWGLEVLEHARSTLDTMLQLARRQYEAQPLNDMQHVYVWLSRPTRGEVLHMGYVLHPPCTSATVAHTLSSRERVESEAVQANDAYAAAVLHECLRPGGELGTEWLRDVLHVSVDAWFMAERDPPEGVVWTTRLPSGTILAAVPPQMLMVAPCVTTPGMCVYGFRPYDERRLVDVDDRLLHYEVV